MVFDQFGNFKWKKQPQIPGIIKIRLQIRIPGIKISLGTNFHQYWTHFGRIPANFSMFHKHFSIGIKLLFNNWKNVKRCCIWIHFWWMIYMENGQFNVKNLPFSECSYSNARLISFTLAHALITLLKVTQKKNNKKYPCDGGKNLKKKVKSICFANHVHWIWCWNQPRTQVNV